MMDVSEFLLYRGQESSTGEPTGGFRRTLSHQQNTHSAFTSLSSSISSRLESMVF